MSRGSQRVKEWRARTKERIVIAMGGACVCCGYNTCHSVLHCHHTDPTQKEFSFGAIRANPAQWSTIVDELMKCVLVCANCHGEIHAGIRQVPADARRFHESYSSYTTKLPVKTTTCPVCGKLKSNWQITCSPQCAGKRARKVDWDAVDIAELFRLHKTTVKVAEVLGISDVAVHKRMKKMNKHNP